MTANKQLQIITEVIREEVRFLIYERKYLKESEFEISKEDLMKSDIYTLKRIIPEDRGMNWPLK